MVFSGSVCDLFAVSEPLVEASIFGGPALVVVAEDPVSAFGPTADPDTGV